MVVSLGASLSFASDTKTQQEGIALIQQAIDKTNIFELPAFTLKAKVTVNSKGKDVDGTYELFWNGPDQWREQIQFPDYGEIRVGGKGVVFTKRSLDFTPVEMFGLHSALGFSSLALPDSSFLRVLPHKDEVVKKIHERKEGGENAKCVEIENQKQHSREVCIAESTGLLLRGDPHKDRGNDYEDRDFTAVGTKMFPRSLKRSGGGEPSTSISVTEIKLRDSFPEKSFDPPEGSSSQPGCMNPDLPTNLIKVPPHYPDPERRARIEGSVQIDATIGADGRPRDLQLIDGQIHGLNEAALQCIDQWRYEPARCGNVPVSTESLIRVIFSISP